MSASSTRKMVSSLVESGQDFEWYPTTTEIMEIIKRDIDDSWDCGNPSMLDCGAGDGRVLNFLTEGNKYAIEKSVPLLNAMKKDVYIVGTEFVEQTLLDKMTDTLFSNPPYSVFEMWTKKIIREANCSDIYLVIPSRWTNCEEIQEIIALRQATVTILGSFDFLDAERQARATVDVVKVHLGYKSRRTGSRPIVDAFDLWFSQNFHIDANKNSFSDHESQSQSKSTLRENIKNELVKGVDLVSTLEKFYQRDLAKLINTFQSLSDIDSDILLELDVNLDGIKESLKLKISGLKNVYWHELFNSFDKITDRLTTRSRETLLKKLTANTHVDFTVSNVHAVVIFVIKNANEYFDSQLIDMMKAMTEKANVRLYKSNMKTFRDEDWRFCRKPGHIDRYSLDYRIVLEHVGGLHYGFGSDCNGLSSRAADFLNDLCAIASNIGFDTYRLERAKDFHWESGTKGDFQYRDIKSGKLKTLFIAKAFKKGNIHLMMDKKFIMRLNVEFGRLQGWVKSPREASEEMDVPFDEAAKSFGTNLKLEKNSFLQLCHAA